MTTTAATPTAAASRIRAVLARGRVRCERLASTLMLLASKSNQLEVGGPSVQISMMMVVSQSSPIIAAAKRSSHDHSVELSSEVLNTLPMKLQVSSTLAFSSGDLILAPAVWCNASQASAEGSARSVIWRTSSREMRFFASRLRTSVATPAFSCSCSSRNSSNWWSARSKARRCRWTSTFDERTRRPGGGFVRRSDGSTNGPLQFSGP